MKRRSEEKVGERRRLRKDGEEGGNRREMKEEE